MTVSDGLDPETSHMHSEGISDKYSGASQSGAMNEEQSRPSRLPLFLAWTMLLVASPIAIIPWRIFTIGEPFWWPWMHGIILLLLLLLTLVLQPLKPLRRFAFIIVVIFFMGYAAGWNWGLIGFVQSTDFWAAWKIQAPMGAFDISLHLLRLTPAAIVLSFLLLTGRKRQRFFLVKGDPHAVLERSSLVSTKKPEPWIRVALIFSLVFVLVAALFMVAVYGVSGETFASNWPLIPVVLLIATMNGFNEEFTLRAAPLGELEPVIGKSNSLKTTAAYFGLGHYFGFPSGVIGVILSGFLGWFLGKSMLETKGIFVAWLVHFLTDVPIFLFLIVGGVA